MLRVSETEGRRTRRKESHSASYRQLGRTLLDLQRAADQLFDSISRKTAEERDKLSTISRRIQVAKDKIDRVSNSEKERTIVSPAQHPSANATTDDFKPLFQYKNKEEDQIAKLLINGGLNREYGTDGTLELLQFFSEENIKYPLKESDFPKIKDDLSLEKIFYNASLLSENNISSSKCELKEEELPSPPPSLCPTNFTFLSKSDLRLKSSSSQ
ncbi:hypothetical protein LUZ60_006253 [Juncus effusus]|nr:hypothetical protein LUZ60_006253 [Juncus effusus]